MLRLPWFLYKANDGYREIPLLWPGRSPATTLNGG
jgi:hypothetical protein